MKALKGLFICPSDPPFLCRELPARASSPFLPPPPLCRLSFGEGSRQVCSCCNFVSLYSLLGRNLQCAVMEPTVCSGGATCWELGHISLLISGTGQIEYRFADPARALGSLGWGSAPPGVKKVGLGWISRKVPRGLGFLQLSYCPVMRGPREQGR